MIYKYDTSIFLEKIRKILCLEMILSLINNYLIKSMWFLAVSSSLILIVVIRNLFSYKAGKELSVAILDDGVVLFMGKRQSGIFWYEINTVEIDDLNNIYLELKENQMVIPISKNMENIEGLIKELTAICIKNNINVRRAVELS